MADKMTARIALDYLKNKNLKPAFSYKDVWHEEHATAFTVAKAMQIDVLSNIKTAVEKAIESGQTFEQFKKNLKPTLIEKGWWGTQDMIDPLTGKMMKAQLGSDRRLKTIYRNNLRSAYQKGRYDRTMASPIHPYMMYRIGPSQHHRKSHVQWNGLILAKDDSWWNAHFPPNEYGCNCYTVAVTETRKQTYEQEGIPVPPNTEGASNGTITAQTERPRTTYKTMINPRKGTIEKVPNGVSPAFNWNQGLAGREVPLFQSFMEKGQKAFAPQIEEVAKSILTSQIKKSEFTSFIDRAYAGTLNADYATPLGFIDSVVSTWLKHKAGIDVGDNVTIALEARLLNATKATRHSKAGNAIGLTAAKNMIENLLFAQVYFERHTGNLIYIGYHSEQNVSKIVVAPIRLKKTSSGSLSTPTVVSAHTIPASEKSEEYIRITQKLERIK